MYSPGIRFSWNTLVVIGTAGYIESDAIVNMSPGKFNGSKEGIVKKMVAGCVVALGMIACNNPSTVPESADTGALSKVECSFEPQLLSAVVEFPPGTETIHIDSILVTITDRADDNTVHTSVWRASENTLQIDFIVEGGRYGIELEYYGTSDGDPIHYADSRRVDILPGNTCSIVVDPGMIGQITVDAVSDAESYAVRYEVTGSVSTVEFVNAMHSGNNNNFEYDATLPWSYVLETNSMRSFYVSSRFKEGSTGTITTAIYIDEVKVYSYTATCKEGDCSDVFSSAAFGDFDWQ
jgi:hypothetical protein